ncbi:MAG TPA: C4-type zinc ribbon domain-containing protein [Ktedonobacteraceae bacterium]|nr:C4-type zinc ribbon domain-containing protein [Ktedonobacteraceae bacterium]
MSATQIAAALYQLQQIDLELDRLTTEQQSLSNSLQDNATLQKARTEHTSAQQQLRAGQQAQKEAEWTLEDLSRRISTQEQRLYNGTVSNPKELASLQQEVQRLQAQQNRQEDRVLEIIETTEALQETAQRKATALQKAEETWQQENAAMILHREQLEAHKQEAQTKRTAFASGIDAALLSRYEVMRRTKQGRAVSKVEQSSCQWCRVILTPSELQRVRINSDLQTCSNCGRILYYDR